MMTSADRPRQGVIHGFAHGGRGFGFRRKRRQRFVVCGSLLRIHPETRMHTGWCTIPIACNSEPGHPQVAAIFLRRFLFMSRLLIRAFVLAVCAAFTVTGLSSSSDFLKDYAGTPYHDSHYDGGAQKIPGKVLCAYYDLGGEGVAYHDSDAKNNGSGILNPPDGSYLHEFRMHEGVDTSYTKFNLTPQIDDTAYEKVQPPANMFYVGWTVPGEWFNITVEVASAGEYAGRSALHLQPRRNNFFGCEWQASHGTTDPRLHLQLRRPDRLASVAPLECRTRSGQGISPQRQVGVDPSHSDKWADEPGDAELSEGKLIGISGDLARAKACSRRSHAPNRGSTRLAAPKEPFFIGIGAMHSVCLLG